MNIKKYLSIGALALTLGLSSCVGDLNLEPNDPNNANPDSPEFKEQLLSMCYLGIATSGISGPGSSYVSGLDAGTSAYLRMIFTLSEFCSDELVWIWADAGVTDIVSCTWAANNGLLEGCYYRLIGHIAICNQFLAKYPADPSDVQLTNLRAQVRTLRAYSYYNLMDLFGQVSFITEEAEIGENPVQVSRAWIFNWIESELTDIVDNNQFGNLPVTYGQMGVDAAEGLLARLYLNGELYTGTPYWKQCATRCSNIIARHQGTGYQGSGLVENYLYVFCRDNNKYMPGGSGVNEILFGIAYDSEYTQSYGGPSFIISSTVSNTHYLPRVDYGCASEWSCIRGIKQMAARFESGTPDTRCSLWLRGGEDVFPAGKEGDIEWGAENYSDTFVGFTGDWSSCGGNAIIKFTGNVEDPNNPGELMKSIQYPDGTSFAGTDQPIIRLADIYLMYAECYIHDASSADPTLGKQYVDWVRGRAGVGSLGDQTFSISTLMDERSRELYLESVRRTDLLRNDMFVGPTQSVWQYKGNIDNNEGTQIAEKYGLYPIPSAVLYAQPDFKQNPGY
ncbi:MAG: RagB/SusD family nutrient uptake outer membrane protein [Muribaculaceae bacterium]|nr:RagB/SusD family nutrient uptake outer membrane protein [Muribaculaceae bacterium]